MNEQALKDILTGLGTAFGAAAVKEAVVELFSGPVLTAAEATAAVDAAEEAKLALIDAGTVADPTPEE